MVGPTLAAKRLLETGHPRKRPNREKLSPIYFISHDVFNFYYIEVISPCALDSGHSVHGICCLNNSRFALYVETNAVTGFYLLV
jgi:hypothetical protein